MTNLEHALEYAEKLGWYVFPCWWVEGGACACGKADCDSPGKHPLGALVPHGVQEATTDPKVIRHWWRKYPQANIAVHCGPSGFIAMDLDSYKEIFAPKAVEKLLTTDDQDTVTNLTPSGGQHLLFKNSVQYGNNRKLFPPGIDIRSWGAYIMLPPSNHVAGKLYEWEADNSPFDREMREIPDKVKALLDEMERRATEGRAKAAERAFDVAPELEKVAEALKFIPNWSASDKAGGLSYDEWLAVLMAVHSAYPDEEGIAVCENWSPGSNGEIAAKWAGFKPGGGITIRTLAKMANDHGWKGNLDADWREGFSPVHMSIDIDAGEVTEAAPADGALPFSTWPYLNRNGRLVVVRERTKDGETETEYTPIADMTAAITGEIIDEYGEKTFVIEGAGVRSGAYRVEVPALEFGVTAKIAAVLDSISPKDGIKPKMATHLGPAIKALTTETAITHRYSRLGWRGDKFLIPGREPAGVEIKLDDKAGAYSLAGAVNTEESTLALDLLIDGIGEWGTVVAAHVLLPPLAGACGWTDMRYGLYLRGITGSLKTTSARLAMSIWGQRFATEDQPFEKLGQNGATPLGILGRAAEMRDLPFMIDNFKPAVMRPDDMVSLIHGMMEAYSKSRQTRNGKNAPAVPYRFWPLLTGEDVPGADVAANARLIILPMLTRKGVHNEQFQQLQDGLANYLIGKGAALLDALEGPGRDHIVATAKAEFKKSRSEFADHIRKVAPKAENILRSATNLAINQAVWTALAEIPAFTAIVAKREAKHHGALLRLAEALSQHTGEHLEAHRFLSILGELIAAKRVYVEPQSPQKQYPGITNDAAPVDGDGDGPELLYGSTPAIGWYDKAGNLCLLPQLAMGEIDRLQRGALNNISLNAIYDQLRTMDALADFGEGGKTTVSRRRGGKNVRVLVLRPSALGTGDSDENTAEELPHL